MIRPDIEDLPNQITLSHSHKMQVGMIVSVNGYIVVVSKVTSPYEFEVRYLTTWEYCKELVRMVIFWLKQRLGGVYTTFTNTAQLSPVIESPTDFHTKQDCGECGREEVWVNYLGHCADCQEKAQ